MLAEDGLEGSRYHPQRGLWISLEPQIENLLITQMRRRQRRRPREGQELRTSCLKENNGKGGDNLDWKLIQIPHGARNIETKLLNVNPTEPNMRVCFSLDLIGAPDWKSLNRADAC